MPKEQKDHVEFIANGWYWYGNTPVELMDIGGVQVMRGYDFTTKEEFRTPIQNLNAKHLRPIPS